jgi:hypothetical protein
MIRRRQNECQPGYHGLSDTQSLPMPVGLNVFIDDFGQAHLMLLGDQQRYVVYAFISDFHFCHHGRSLPGFCF